MGSQGPAGGPGPVGPKVLLSTIQSALLSHREHCLKLD